MQSLTPPPFFLNHARQHRKRGDFFPFPPSFFLFIYCPRLLEPEPSRSPPLFFPTAYPLLLPLSGQEGKFTLLPPFPPRPFLARKLHCPPPSPLPLVSFPLFVPRLTKSGIPKWQSLFFSLPPRSVQRDFFAFIPPLFRTLPPFSSCWAWELSSLRTATLMPSPYLVFFFSPPPFPSMMRKYFSSC